MPISISKENVKDFIGKSNFHLIDIRSKNEYMASHIPEAENIPTEELKTISFDKTETIVCVCNHGHKRSQEAADLIADMGFENVFYLEGGTASWLNSNKQ